MRGVRGGFLISVLIVALAVTATAQVATVTTWPLPAPGSLPGGLALSGGVVYVALYGPQSIGRFDPVANTLVQWSVDDSPVGLTINDHGVFYTLPGTSVVGTLQPNVNVTTGWGVPTTHGWPERLLSAPTGPGVVNLWFNERTAAKVGRYAPTAIRVPLYLGIDPPPQAIMPRSEEVVPLTQLAAPQQFLANPLLVPPIALAPKITVDGFTEWTPVWSSSYVEALASAPDGRVWFSQGEARLTVLDPSSDGMMPYGLPEGTRAYPVAASITGDIWFGDSARPAIGKLDPTTGNVTLWAIPGGVQPFDLAIDDLGDVWFTDRGASAIYNFRPSTNEFVRWQLGPGRGPLYLALDDLGTIWFTEEGGNAISRLSVLPVLGPPPAVEPPDTSGLTILSWRYAKSGSRATATVNYLYQGGLGLPIYFGLAAVSGGVTRTDFVCEAAAVSAMGTGAVTLVVQYVGSSVTETDAFRLYVALSPTGDAVFWRDFDAQITWYP